MSQKICINERNKRNPWNLIIRTLWAFSCFILHYSDIVNEKSFEHLLNCVVTILTFSLNEISEEIP